MGVCIDCSGPCLARTVGRVEGDKEDVMMRGVSCELLSMGNGGSALGLGGHTTSNIGPYRSEGSVRVTVVVEF